jgi:peroxiredoxin
VLRRGRLDRVPQSLGHAPGLALRHLATGPALTGPARAPAFTVQDVSGRKLALDELRRGGPVLLDFWATWCKPCLESLPELERLHRAYAERGLTVIGISVDGPRNHSKVRPFARRLGLTYPIAIDEDERIRHLYPVVALPTAVLIDTSGAIANVRLGYRPGEGEDLERRIEALLPASAEADSTAPGSEP